MDNNDYLFADALEGLVWCACPSRAPQTHFRRTQRLELPEKLLAMGVHLHACMPACTYCSIRTYVCIYMQHDVMARGAAWGRKGLYYDVD